MKARLLFALVACACAVWPISLCAQEAHEVRIPVGSTFLYGREMGKGPAVIVLHGGPDFDSSYLLPELDRLADSLHLIYYDQRGRGRSADGVKPEDVTLA